MSLTKLIPGTRFVVRRVHSKTSYLISSELDEVLAVLDVGFVRVCVDKLGNIIGIDIVGISRAVIAGNVTLRFLG